MANTKLITTAFGRKKTPTIAFERNNRLVAIASQENGDDSTRTTSF